MKVEKKDLEKSQTELTVEITYEELKPYITEATQKISEETQVEGFRPGKAPYDVLKQKVGEMTILERAARSAINNTVDKAITENVDRQPVGQPRVDITKLAPGEPMHYKVVVAMLPEIELGEYKELNIEPEKAEVTEKEVNDTLENLQQRQATEKSVNREVRQGDKVLVDIDMYQEGVPVEGGQSRDTTVVIGQKNLVEGFDDNLVGVKKNEEKEFSLNYPQDHHQKNLAGKKVDFKVVVKEIYEREVPEIDDNFAKQLGVNILEELKKMVKESLRSQKQEEVQQKTEAKLVDKIIENSKFGDIPDVLANNEAETMVGEMEQTVKSQGGKFEDYLSNIGKSREQLLLDMTPDAIKRVKSALVIRDIANRENIEVTEEEVDKKQNELLEQYKGYQKVEERVKQDSYRNYLRNIIANRKVIDKLREWNLKQEEQSAEAVEEHKSETEEKGGEDTAREEKETPTPQEPAEKKEQKDSEENESQKETETTEKDQEESGPGVEEKEDESVKNESEETGQDQDSTLSATGRSSQEEEEDLRSRLQQEEPEENKQSPSDQKEEGEGQEMSAEEIKEEFAKQGIEIEEKEGPETENENEDRDTEKGVSGANREQEREDGQEGGKEQKVS